jgi:hypothetical protein
MRMHLPSEFVADLIVLNFLCVQLWIVSDQAWRIPHILDEVNDDSILKTGRFPPLPHNLCPRDSAQHEPHRATIA